MGAQRLSASLESSPRSLNARALKRGSAQRLSASLESSPRHLLLPLKGCAECSTPFGIIGIFTLFKLLGHERLLKVLNAFRHHWNLHPNQTDAYLLDRAVL